MKKLFLLLIHLYVFSPIQAQLSSEALLDKSIQYHDPTNKWATFQATLHFHQELSDNKSRKREVTINRAKGNFHFKQIEEDLIIERGVKPDGSCIFAINGNKQPTDTELKEHRLNCERNKMYRNYYLYLYGLPMKLKDKGTIIDEKILDTQFQEQEAYGLRVTYDEAVGTDIWYFYFDKNTYQLMGYRFYHDEVKNDGEYITLKDEIIIDGIKIPKTRSWYTHQEDKFLGTDDLEE